MESSRLRIALAGSVSSSRRTLQALLRHQANLVGVLGLSPEVSKSVSGYCRLDDLAQGADIPYVEFQNINHTEAIETIRKWAPDLLFVVGLSQLIKSELLAIPRIGCIGFHPTRLPENRGRAPLAWLILDGSHGAASFFVINDGVDAGPILVQEPFYVSEQDYASDVVAKMESAIDTALDRWLPLLLAGEWKPEVQASALATYNGSRKPEDGLIDWYWSAQLIQTLVRATSHPHPGAHTYVDDHKLTIWRAEIESKTWIRGTVGRIVSADPDKGWLIQTGQGLLWINETEFAPTSEGAVFPKLRVGMRLGYSSQGEIFSLKQRVKILEQRLLQLERLDSRV